MHFKLRSHLALSSLVRIASSFDLEAPLGRGCLVSGGEPTDSPVLLSDTKLIPDHISVDVHFHLASTEEHEQLITDNIVNAQWKVLHDAFAKHAIELTLKSTNRVVDNKTGSAFLVYEGPEQGWVNYEEEATAYYMSTRKGGYDAMNLYFFTDFGPGATGYCQWPTVVAEGDNETFGIDSCRLSALTMPGITLEQGGFESWNLGHLTIHEAGHWFGLNHTFTGGCSGDGDFVSDTPAQLDAVYGCPLNSDSCPSQPGLDPIHNFMGYADDNCTTEFTPKQKERMFQTFFNFRRHV